MTVQSVTISGKSGEGVTSPLFGTNASLITVAQAVRVHLANQRQGTAKVKTRGEVDRTKKKWYKQKGTGGARHGARSAPIFVGGGVSHGPTGLTNWTLKFSKPMRKAALRAAFATQATDGKVMVVEGLEKIGTKTKEVAQMLVKTGVGDAKVLIVTGATNANLIRAGRNIQTLLVSRADRVNTFEIMSAHKILITPEALSVLEVKLGKKETAEVSPKEDKKESKKKVATKEKVAKPAKKTVRKAVKKTETKK